MTTRVPAVLANLRTQLLARPALSGVAVHPYDVGAWADNEAIVFGQVEAPASWSSMTSPGLDETATLSGYVFAGMAGNADTAATTAQARAGILLDELVAQVTSDPKVNNAIDGFWPPLLTAATWQTWADDIDQAGVIRIRVNWTLTWTAGA